MQNDTDSSVTHGPAMVPCGVIPDMKTVFVRAPLLAPRTLVAATRMEYGRKMRHRQAHMFTESWVSVVLASC